jgi:hypothetical protein
MKKQMFIKFIVLVSLFFMPSLFAQAGEDEFTKLNYTDNVSNRGTSAASFLEIGIGARAESMGGAYTALAEDATALYWNPAGISSLQSVSLSANHTNWLADTKFQYFGLVIPMGDYKAFGLSFTFLDYMDKQPVRTISQPEGTGEYYDASDMAIGLSYAMNITSSFSFGITGKYIHQAIWHETAQAFAVDLGVLYQTELKGLSLGASLSNFGTDMQLDGRDLVRAYDEDVKNYSNDKLNVLLKTDEFSLPLLFRFGVVYKKSFDDHNFTLAADVLHPSNNVESMNVGMEYSFKGIVSVRGGYQSLFDDKSEAGYTLGFGIKNPFSDFLNIGFNYAYTDWGRLNSVQRFSIEMSF